jgi:hypothetical protein
MAECSIRRMQILHERLAKCETCQYFKFEKNGKPFCEWQGAYLEPRLMPRDLQCEGYIPKRRG